MLIGRRLKKQGWLELHQPRNVAMTLRMRNIIRACITQAWTAVSALLGLVSIKVTPRSWRDVCPSCFKPLSWEITPFILKCYYDENHIFSIEAILRHKQVACMRRKMLYFFQISFFVPEIFKFLKYVMTSYTHSSFDQIWWKKISRSICIKNVSFFADSTKCALQFGLNNFIPMATYWVPDSPILKVFLATLCVQFPYLQTVPDINDPTSI